MPFRTLKDAGNLAGKRVLLRVDLNVPVKDGAVTDTTRIERVAPTIKALSDQGARVALLAHFERLPETHLKAVFLHCAHESSRRMFDLDEAVPCAMAWDALLKRGFAGNVEALLAWWRAQRDLAP